MSTPSIEPAEVVDIIEGYVETALRDSEKFSNSSPLDESGVFSLHLTAARIYALGFRDGEQSESRRNRASRARKQVQS